MNYEFALEFKKLAEEQVSRKDRAKHIAKVVVPTILGMGAGSLAASQLEHHLPKIQNPTAKNITKGLLMVGTPIAANIMIPGIRSEWQKILTSKPKKETKN
jgi:hypothetical protein